MTEEELIEIARYYIKNEVSIEGLSNIFKYSASSIKRHFNKECQVRLPYILQKAVDLKKQKNWIEAKSTSGNAGNKVLSAEQIINAANLYSNGSYSLRELADPLNVSPATLYNNFKVELLGEDLYLSVESIYKKHKEEKGRKK